MNEKTINLEDLKEIFKMISTEQLQALFNTEPEDPELY